MEPISETVSENHPKRKRGRPPAFDESFLTKFSIYFPDVKTRRGLQNRVYASGALNALKGDPRFAWICSTADRNNPHIEHGVLAELGRVTDENELRAVALRVCNERMPPKIAREFVRTQRLGNRKRPADALELTKRLIRCVNEYLSSHSGATWQIVRGAIANLSDAVEQSATASEDEPGEETEE